MKQPQTAQDLFRVSRTDWVSGARAVARRLLRTRHRITIEDVLDLYPRPKYIHRNTTGGVFQYEWFQKAGFTLARRPSSHKRVIRYWTLSDEYTDEREGCD